MKYPMWKLDNPVPRDYLLTQLLTNKIHISAFAKGRFTAHTVPASITRTLIPRS